MLYCNYILRYHPLFYRDLEDTVMYIALHLQNPQAASNLMDRVEAAILERLPIAESFEPYHSVQNFQNTYYRIYVGNYTVYYTVLSENGATYMEVRRFLYSGRNISL